MHDYPNIQRWMSLATSPSAVSKAIKQRVLGTITHVATQDPVVALTFDDGPHPDSTPRLLDSLEKHQARATFFVLGEAAQQYPKIIHRAAEAGHAIGSQGWNHPSFPLITRRERRAQLRSWEKAIAPHGQRLFRPPYGHQSIASRFDALLLGYKVIAWNLAAFDWLDRDAEWIADWVVGQTRPGDVIVFHDVLYHTMKPNYVDRKPMLEAVDLILKQLGDRFRFITVPELLRHGRPQRKCWFLKADPSWLNALQAPYGQPRHYPVDGRPASSHLG
jgi:peptidoglycan/xylan/chitin deacetylase (PgdA/CDA1 family)